MPEDAWEYCSVSLFRSSMGVVRKWDVVITYFFVDDTEEQKLEFTEVANVDGQVYAFGKTLAYLGQDGWELVSADTMPKDRGAYFLKRLVIKDDASIE